MARARRSLGTKNKVPVWALALTCENLSESLRHLLCRCLREEHFPLTWRRAKLVLRKESKPPYSLLAYKPICLFDEVGKLFERVIANRIVEHLFPENSDLHDH